MAVSGVTEFANIIPELWSPRFYQNLKKNLPVTNFFSRDYEGEIRNLGDTVNINEFENPTAETLTDDKQNFATEAVSISKQQLVIDRRISTAYEITDLAQLQSLSFQNELIQNMSYALAKNVEEYVVSLISSSAAAPDHVITTATANKLALADLITCAGLLSTQGVAKSNRAFFGSADFYYDIVGDTAVSSRDYSPGGSVVSGEIPFPVVGFEFQEAQNLAAELGYACHKSALTVAMQQDVRIQISSLHSSKAYGYIISADLVLGAKQLDSGLRTVTITGS